MEEMPAAGGRRPSRLTETCDRPNVIAMLLDSQAGLSEAARQTPAIDAAELAAGDAKRWLDALTRAEIQELRQMNDWHSWASVLTNWGLVFAAFALVAYAAESAHHPPRARRDRHAAAGAVRPDARSGAPHAVQESHA